MTLCPDNYLSAGGLVIIRSIAVNTLFMKTSTMTASSTPVDLNSVCVDVVDHGIVDLPWGRHPRISLFFETDLEDENGNPRILSRSFNNYAYSKSALTGAIRNWLGIDLSGKDEDYDLKDCVGEQARLRTSETVSGSGKTYQKIEEIRPASAVCVQPSGNYRRKDEN